MFSSNEKISLRQMQVLIILASLGTGVMVLPRRVAEFAGQDGWLVVLGLTVIAMVLTALVTMASRVKQDATFVANAGFALTRPVAHFLAMVLWVKLVLVAGLELRTFLLISHKVLLPDTPIFLVSGLLLATCGYAAVKGIEARARVAEVLVLILALPMFFLFVIALLDINMSNLQPLLTTPPRNLLSGTLRLGFIFTGLECLLLVSPYVAQGKKITRAAVTAVGFAGLLITVITVITLAKFGVGILDEPWPVLRLMDRLRLPGSFIERQEALMFSFWIVSIFALVNALLFFGGRLLADITHKHKRNFPFVFITALAVFAVTVMPRGEAEIYRLLDILYYTGGVFFLFILPVLILFGAWLRKSIRRKAKAVLLVLLFIPLLSLTACYDRIEIENRSFVVGIGVDKTEAGYAVTLCLPASSKENEESDGEKFTLENTAKTLTEALHLLQVSSDKRLYYGQAKILVIGGTLLSDADAVKNVLTTFTRHPEIDGQIYVLAAEGEAAEIMKASLPGESMPGLYIAERFRDNRKTKGNHFSMDMETLTTQLKSGSGLLPRIKNEDKNLQPNGAVIIKDYTKTAALSPEELKGYLWCFPGKNQHSVVTVEHAGKYISFTADKHDARIRFHTIHGSTPRAVITVHVEGRFTETGGISDAVLKRLLTREITEEIRETANKIQAHNADVYHWKAHLRKNQYPLYRQHNSTWDEHFPLMEVVPIIHIKT